MSSPSWGRWRYDLVAVLALLVAVAVGIVPPDQAFKGFSDDIVIIVASALVVSAISPPCRRRSANSTTRRWPSATFASAVA